MAQDFIFKAAEKVGQVANVVKNFGSLIKAGYLSGYHAAEHTTEQVKEEAK